MPVKLTIEEKKKSQSKASIKYDASHTTRVFIKLNDGTDADILAYLQTLPNKQGHIKQLLRKDMEEAGFVYTKEETQ